MNNEPVAWLYERPNGASKLSFVKEKMLWEDMTEIPLYTHPADLIDAIKLLEKYADKLEDQRPNKGLSDVVLDCVEILRKANEK